jgi:hypothetical protein
MNSLELLEVAQVRSLKVLLGQYMVSPDEEGIKQLVDTEMAKIQEIVETNRRAQANSQQQQ